MDLPYWSSLITQYSNKDADLVFKEILQVQNMGIPQGQIP